MEIRQAVALMLLQSGEAFLSGELLSERFGISRAAVWKHVQTLREEGWQIESVPHRGYRIVRAPDRMHPALIFQRLETSRYGRNLVCLDECDSTNIRARTLAQEGAPDGTVVVAQEQTAGRGRRGRSWVSEPDCNIYMSLVLRPPVRPEEAPKLTLAAALAVQQAVARVCGAEAGIKWPNDLLLRERKFCGILTELSADVESIHFAVVGIGVNVNALEFPPEIAEVATSIRAYTGERVERNTLCAAILLELERLMELWQEQGFASLMERYRQKSVTLGQNVRISGVNSEVTGVVDDFDEMGRILLRTETGEIQTIVSGDVTLRRI